MRTGTEEEFLAYCLEHGLSSELEIKLALEEFQIVEPGDEKRRQREDYRRRMQEHREEERWIKQSGDWTLVVWKQYLQPLEIEDEDTGEIRKVFPKIGRIEVLGSRGKTLGSQFVFTVYRRGGKLQFRDGRKEACRSRVSGAYLSLEQLIESMPGSRANALEAVLEALSYFGVRI